MQDFDKHEHSIAVKPHITLSRQIDAFPLIFETISKRIQRRINALSSIYFLLITRFQKINCRPSIKIRCIKDL